MLNVFNKSIDSNAIFTLQSKQYQEKILVSGSCKANSETVLKTSISSLGSFISQFITGSFTTLTKDENENIVDHGYNNLKIKLVDGSNQRQLFNDYIPVDLLLSLGRIRSELATNNDQPTPSQLFYPFEFEYLFGINSEILIYVQNSSDVAQDLNICFHGIRTVGL